MFLPLLPCWEMFWSNHTLLLFKHSTEFFSLHNKETKYPDFATGHANSHFWDLEGLTTVKKKKNIVEEHSPFWKSLSLDDHKAQWKTCWLPGIYMYISIIFWVFLSTTISCPGWFRNKEMHMKKKWSICS